MSLVLSADLLRVSDVSSRQRLHSATTSPLVGRRTNIGAHAFAAASPAVWNILPKEVRLSSSLKLFRRRLKAELFGAFWTPCDYFQTNVTLQFFLQPSSRERG